MNCLCCNHSDIKKRFTKNGFAVYECQNCQFGFVHPLPTTEQIVEHYNQTILVPDLTDRIEKAVRRVRDGKNSPKRDWFDRIIGLGKAYVGKDKLDILEIGSGLGLFIDYANRNDQNAVGTEISREYAEAGRGLILGAIQYVEDGDYEAHFRGRTFDFIYMEHVLEHLADPRRFLNGISSLLREDGILVLVVPNHRSLMARLQGKRHGWTNPPDHLYYYNVNALQYLLESVGLQMAEHWIGDYYHRSIYQFYSLNEIRHKFNRMLNRAFGLSLPTKHSYRYPRTVADILTLLPYWILLPFFSVLRHRVDIGNELTGIFRKANTDGA